MYFCLANKTLVSVSVSSFQTQFHSLILSVCLSVVRMCLSARLSFFLYGWLTGWLAVFSLSRCRRLSVCLSLAAAAAALDVALSIHPACAHCLSS